MKTIFRTIISSSFVLVSSACFAQAKDHYWMVHEGLTYGYGAVAANPATNTPIKYLWIVPLATKGSRTDFASFAIMHDAKHVLHPDGVFQWCNSIISTERYGCLAANMRTKESKISMDNQPVVPNTILAKLINDIATNKVVLATDDQFEALWGPEAAEPRK